MARLLSFRFPQSSIKWGSLGLESLGGGTEKLQLFSLWGPFSCLCTIARLILICGLLFASYWWSIDNSFLIFGFPHMRSPKPFRFLDLPAEIRFMIYQKLLCANDGRIKIYNYNIERRTHIYPSILCVNSLIYSEAAPVLYDRNVIDIHCSYDSLWPIRLRDLFRIEDDVISIAVGARSGRLWTCRPERLMSLPLARPATHRPVKVHPHRFRRMRQIEITIKTAGVYCGPILCEVNPEQRQHIVSLLKSLICVPRPYHTIRKNLKLIHQPHHLETPPSPRSNEMRELFDHMNQKCVLLQCLSRTRMVQVINMSNDKNRLPSNTVNYSPSKLVESIFSIRHARAHYFLTPFDDEEWMRQLEEKTTRRIVGRVADLAD